MARFSRLDVYNAMLSTGLVPLFYHGEPETAASIVQALADGGARVVEFTNRGEYALRVFTHLSDKLAAEKSSIILGVGSIMDAPTAALFIANGANFIVSPSFNPEVARLCNRRKIAYLPGCATATEITAAEELGVEIVKVFPGETVGGPAFVKAIMGPMPWTKIMPTGGVEPTAEGVAKWVKAGAVCLGMGSNLVSKEAVASANYAGIRDTVQRVLQFVKDARG